mgnify:CR=1 FL=1
MSYCTKCSKAIRSLKFCNFCKDQFCSESCLEHHINYFHLNGQNLKKPKSNRIRNNNNLYNNNGFVKISDYFSSPYITKGTMLMTKPVFDKTYSLNNFEPVIENGKQKIIGSGSYGKVFLAINKIDKKYYAIKRMQKKNLIKALKTLKGIYNEIDIQSRINHKNIVKLYYVKESKDAFDLVMEYAKYGNLYVYIKKNSYLSEEKSFKYFIQVVNAIYFLHKNDLIHRDIKPENILMFKDGIVKLCDFGWCARLDGGQRITFCGTVEYMSPEMVNKEEYSKEIDIWSLGILLYEMTHGYSPFKPDKAKFNIYDVIDNIKIKDLKFANDISKECKELIIHLLDRDITKRYKVEDIFNSKFVKYYENKDKINNFKSKDEKNDIYIKNIEKENPIENNNNIVKEIKDTTEKDKKIDDINYKKNMVISHENIFIEKDFQNIKSKAKNNTARNFYPNITEKEIIDINMKKNKFSSNCKVKNTQNKFSNNKGITERNISHNNLNNYFKNAKRNVKEKSKTKANSTFDLFKEITNEEMKYQSENRNIIYNNDRRIKSSNSSLTNSIIKKSGQKAKNRQISVENKTNNLIKDIIEETNEMNFFDKKINYTNRLRTRNSCENYIQDKMAIKSQEYMNSKNDNEKKVQKMIDNVKDNIKNIIKDNINISKKKTATKAKIKNLQNEDNNDEIKINIDNDNTVRTKRNTKVKNYYLSGGGIHNLLSNNKKNNYNSSSSPQINIINNNPIFNNNIINYSTYILNDKNNKSNVENEKKNDIFKNFGYQKKSPNHGIILLVHNEGNKQKQNYCPIKSRLNKDNNSTQSNNLSIQDLDETPKKYIDNVKINPQELLENFSKELNCYLSKK